MRKVDYLVILRTVLELKKPKEDNMPAMTDTLTDTFADIAQQVDDALGNLWAVLVHDDDVTTFETVITALVRIFHYEHQEAEQIAWTVHTQGKAVVAVVSKDEASQKVSALKSYKITASAAPA